jgi:large subunit ribosomal protein L15
VEPEQLSEAGLIAKKTSKVKILGKGNLTKKLQVTAHKFSKNAEQKIKASGGKTSIVTRSV